MRGKTLLTAFLVLLIYFAPFSFRPSNSANIQPLGSAKMSLDSKHRLVDFLKLCQSAGGITGQPDLRSTFFAHACLVELNSTTRPVNATWLNASSSWIVSHQTSQGGFARYPYLEEPDAEHSYYAVFCLNASRALSLANITSLNSWLSSQQKADGSFNGSDTAFYVAFCLNITTSDQSSYLDVPKVVSWLASLQNLTKGAPSYGGFGRSSPENASLKWTYFALRALWILNGSKLGGINKTAVYEFVNSTYSGDGSYNGTLEDTFYAFYSLYVLNQSGYEAHLKDASATLAFVKSCQYLGPYGAFKGGFSPKPNLNYSRLDCTYYGVFLLEQLGPDPAENEAYRFVLSRLNRQQEGIEIYAPSIYNSSFLKNNAVADEAAYGILAMDLITNKSVSESVICANYTGLLAYLSECQNSTSGGFGAFPGSEERMSWAYASILALKSLGELGRIDIDKAVTWVLSCWNSSEGGFSSSPGNLDQMTLRDTFFALSVLNMTARPRLSEVKENATKWILECYDNKTGAFSPYPGGPSSVEACYFGVTSLAILGSLDRINASLSIQWINSSRPWGTCYQTFAALNALKLLGADIGSFKNESVSFILSLQTAWGGFKESSASKHASLNSTYSALAVLEMFDAIPVLHVSLKKEFDKPFYYESNLTGTVTFVNDGEDVVYSLFVNDNYPQSPVIDFIGGPLSKSVPELLPGENVSFSYNFSISRGKRGGVNATVPAVNATFYDYVGDLLSVNTTRKVILVDFEPPPVLIVDKEIHGLQRVGGKLNVSITIRSLLENYTAYNVSVIDLLPENVTWVAEPQNLTIFKITGPVELPANVTLKENSLNLTVRELGPRENVTFWYLVTPVWHGSYTFPPANITYYDRYGFSYNASSAKSFIDIEKPYPPTLRVEKSVVGPVYVGEWAKVIIRVKNEGNVTVYNVTLSENISWPLKTNSTLSFNLSSLAPNETATFEYFVQSPLEGSYKIGPTLAKFYDVYGYLYKTRSASTWLHVLMLPIYAYAILVSCLTTVVLGIATYYIVFRRKRTK